jgi:ATP-dependent Clp protease ATP-binding subunit ClpA
MEISEFSRDLTAEAEAGLIEPPIGRDSDLEFIFRVLNQDEKSNVLITGPAGCGKTALAEGVAYHLVNNKIYSEHKRKKLITLDLTALNSGAMYVGQFEERVTKFLDEVRSDNSIVVFIDEIHMLMGFGKTGSAGASRDLSQIIKPALARGEMSCIGATTREEFDQYIAPDGAFVRRFSERVIEPLGNEAVQKILKRISVKYRYTNGVEVTDETLTNIIQVSDEKWPTRYQPDKAIDLFRLITMKNEPSIKNNNNPSMKQSLESYIEVLNSEIAMINQEDYSGLNRVASKWLGLNANIQSAINLNLQEVRNLVESK